VTEAVQQEFEKRAEQSKSPSATASPPRDEAAATRAVDLPAAQQAAAETARAHSGLQFGLKDGQGLADARTVARFLDVSGRSLYKLMAVQAMPPPISLGRSKRWIVEEILAWVYAGCPNQDRWKRTKILAIRDYRTWTAALKK
jgi:predicted DNA-binding transcriptional regulator AlpA